MRIASCTCGQLKASCTGEPVRVSLCHCLNCKRRSGSAFALQARWPIEHVMIEGEAKEFQLTGDEGTTATFRFCPTCGATVYFSNATMPELIAIPVGAFADPTFPPPQYTVYGGRRHPWLSVDASIEEMR